MAQVRPAANDAEPSLVLLVAAFAAVYVVWGSTYLAIRFAIETIPPFTMAGVRFLVAGTILYAWMRARGVAAPERPHWRAAAVSGTLMLLVGNGCVVWAEQRVPSGLTALLLATMPLWMVLLEWWFWGARRPGAMLTVFLLTGFAGAALLVRADAAAGAVDPAGALLLVVAALSWATGSLYARTASLPASARLGTAMQMLVAGSLFLVVGGVGGELPAVARATVSVRSAASLAYLVVFGSIVAFSAYGWLLRVSEPARVSTYAYVNPVVAVLLGWWLADEALTGRMLVAAAVIVVSVAAIITNRGARARPSSPA